MNMKQQVMIEPGKIIFQDVPVPETGMNDVRIRIKNIGICGSDIHVYHGQHPFTSYPVTRGMKFPVKLLKLENLSSI